MRKRERERTKGGKSRVERERERKIKKKADGTLRAKGSGESITVGQRCIDHLVALRHSTRVSLFATRQTNRAKRELHLEEADKCGREKCTEGRKCVCVCVRAPEMSS